MLRPSSPGRAEGDCVFVLLCLRLEVLVHLDFFWASQRSQAAGGQLQRGPCSSDAAELSPALCPCPRVSKPAGLRQEVDTPLPGVSVRPLLSHQAAGKAENRDRPCDGLWLLCQKVSTHSLHRFVGGSGEVRSCGGSPRGSPSPRCALTEGPGLAAHSRFSRVDSVAYRCCRPYMSPLDHPSPRRFSVDPVRCPFTGKHLPVFQCLHEILQHSHSATTYLVMMGKKQPL